MKQQPWSPQQHQYQHPPVESLPDASPPPEDVNTARQLWWCVAVLWLVTAAATLLSTMLGDRQKLVDQMLAATKDLPVDQRPTAAQTDLYLWIVCGLAIVVLAGVAGLILLVVAKMRRGGLWARMLLTAFGVYLVMSALIAVFAGSDIPGVTMLTGALTVLQAVPAGGAVFLMYRRESNEYFLSRRR